MSQNADDWVWKVPSQPPTRAQQYSRAGPQQRQEKQTFDNGTSFRHRPDDLVTRFETGHRSFTDQVALVDSAIRTVKQVRDNNNSDRTLRRGSGSGEHFNQFRSRALDRSTVRAFEPGTYVEVPSKYATINNPVALYESPNKSDVPGIKHHSIPTEKKEIIEKSIIDGAGALTPSLIPRLPPTEPKADRERKKFQRTQALERNMATLRQRNPPQYGQNISRTVQNANGAPRMNEAMAGDRLPTLQRAQIPDRERIWNGLRVADRGAVMEKAPSLAREPNIEQGGTMVRGRRRHHPNQTHQSYAAQRDMRTRRYQQVYGANAGVQPKPRSRPGQHYRNEHNTQRNNAYNAPNNIANQAGPRPHPHEQRLTSRAMEEKFAREISTIAVVQEETLKAVVTKPAHVRREKQQAKEFADRAIAEVERQVELQQNHANINGLAHSRLSEMPLQPLLVPLADGTVVSIDPRSYQIYQAMYPPHLPPGYIIPPGYPVPLPRVVATMPPNAPPPPMLRVFPPTMQPVMPVFHPLVPPPPVDPSQSSQHIYATSQYKMCNYVDVRAEERHRNPVRIQGAGHLEYEKELWARHLSNLREESLLEDAEFALLDPRQGQRVSQMNSAYRSGPSCFMPPRYSLSPKPEVEYDMRRPRDPLPDPVLMSGSTSGMSTPTLSYRKQHDRHRLNAKKLRERLNKLSVKEGKRPERPSSPKSDSPKAKNLTCQVISRPEPVNAAAVNGAARNFNLAVREKSEQNGVANKQVNGGKDETNLAEKSFLGNTIFGEVPGHVSHKPSPKARAGGRRGRRLFERSPARNPARSPVRTPPNQKRPPRVCLNLSPEWLWKQGGSISSDEKPVDSS